MGNSRRKWVESAELRPPTFCVAILCSFGKPYQCPRPVPPPHPAHPLSQEDLSSSRIINRMVYAGSVSGIIFVQLSTNYNFESISSFPLSTLMLFVKTPTNKQYPATQLTGHLVRFPYTFIFLKLNHAFS